MMLLGSSSYPFSSVETLVYKTLFVRPLNFSPLTESTQSCCSSPNHNKRNGSASAQEKKPSDANKPDQSNPKDAENSKKTD
ncbi:trimeric intracellular cation channel type B [Labeo rohita]|uniref:Trimeric intracellular cation channel type B n=4 Tax=Labeo rohita TaxID=84645 RepID=A0A498LHT7_LABRO|nr:trimeric intracellular cation channel type B [Labeo rohita]RXN18831.1 trimeric intracellular cation channel type B [Labeo rohita]